jgi:hypothetical protein
MLLKDWSKELIVGNDIATYDVDYLLGHIRKRAWEFFRKKVAGKFFIRLFGLEGKIREIFTELFGPEMES